MTTVAFHGGHSVYELGPVSDVALFFELIDVYVSQAHAERDWYLLTDRLYRRYLRQEELSTAAELMNEVKSIFAKFPSSSVVWKQHLLEGKSESQLNISAPTLADVFAKYFESFAKACGSALSFVDCFKVYQPVKTVISDQPWFLLESQRPLDEYDVLQGEPFWLH